MKRFLIFIFFLNAWNGLAQVNLDSGQVACYALNGNGYEPLNYFDGTLSNVLAAPNRFNAGNLAIEFTGNDSSYIALPNNPLLKPNKISFSAWVKADPNSSGYIVFTKNASGANPDGYSLRFGPSGLINTFQVRKSNNITSVMIETGNPVLVSTWNHVCFTIDQNYLKLYLNGVLEDSLHANMNFSYGSGKKVYLGVSHEPHVGGAFKGVLDNVRFYNRILSATEIDSLYSSDPPCIASTSLPVTSLFFSPSVCVGQQLIFSHYSTNHPDRWNWSFTGPDAIFSLLVDPQVTFSTAGNYTAVLVATNNSGSGVASVPFVVNPSPTVTAVANQTIVIVPNSVTLTAGGAITYTWSNSAVGDTMTASGIIPTTFTVTGENVFGCTSTATVYVRFLRPFGVSENSKAIDCSIYPNPTSGKIFIDAFEGNVKEFEIVDLLGTYILSAKMDQNNKINLDLSSYPNGVYFLKLKNESASKIIKIVKESAH